MPCALQNLSESILDLFSLFSRMLFVVYYVSISFVYYLQQQLHATVLLGCFFLNMTLNNVCSVLFYYHVCMVFLI